MLHRSAEARDAMTAALGMPMWTLGDVDVLDAAKVPQHTAVLHLAPLRRSPHALPLCCRLQA